MIGFWHHSNVFSALEPRYMQRPQAGASLWDPKQSIEINKGAAPSSARICQYNSTIPGRRTALAGIGGHFNGNGVNRESLSKIEEKWSKIAECASPFLEAL